MKIKHTIIGVLLEVANGYFLMIVHRIEVIFADVLSEKIYIIYTHLSSY